jgi:DNA-directed RNA polymerase specialized sigma24 family protein
MAKMYTVEGWTMAKIAAVMDCDPKTVRSYLRAAGVIPPAQKKEKV